MRQRMGFLLRTQKDLELPVGVGVKEGVAADI